MENITFDRTTPNEERFKEAYLQIEEKYINLFKGRPSKVINQPHNRLKENFTTYFEGHRNSMKFHEDTWVPLYIRQEVEDAFRAIFSSKSK